MCDTCCLPEQDQGKCGNTDPDASCEKFSFYPNASDQLYMEDIVSIVLEAYELIEKRLKKFGIEIPEGQDDDLFVPLERTIERYGNGEYRHHN